ncbi:MAG: IS1 family transposase, partial [Treponema sp.]|nr:IS1 family transposase [Treponema sp.]
GKRDVKAAKKQGKRIKEPGISYGRAAADGWERLPATFGEGPRLAGREYAAGAEGGDLRLRRRIRRAFRSARRFSQRLFNHLKSFDTAFFYINYGFV